MLTDGTHHIRIGMSHNGSTRYFVTRFSAKDTKCVRNGVVSGIPNASYINQQLIKQMQEIYSIYDTLESADYYSCSQLMQIITDKIKGERPITVIEAWEQFVAYKKPTLQKSTMTMWGCAEKWLQQYFKESYQLRQLNAKAIEDYIAFLGKNGMSVSSQSIYVQPFMQMVTFALRQNLVSYEKHPFKGVRMPKPLVRNVAVSLDELRRIRDAVFTDKQAEKNAFIRDLFMLSFYMCGMNLEDLCRLDLSKPIINFMRKKTITRRPQEETTEFTIQPEARAIIDRIWDNGTFVCDRARNKNGIKNILHKCLPNIKDCCGIDGDFIFYSARKTFAQLANELMIKDSIIEYCLGDAVTNRQRVIGSYISINRRIADKAIRKVFDAVASTKTIDELIDESL